MQFFYSVWACIMYNFLPKVTCIKFRARNPSVWLSGTDFRIQILPSNSWRNWWTHSWSKNRKIRKIRIFNTHNLLYTFATYWYFVARSTKDGNHTAEGWPSSAYNVSKVGVSALTRIQQRELDLSRPGEDIVVNSVHPGYVDTDMTSHKGHLTIERGAEAVVWCSLLPPNVESPRGGYVWHDNQIVDWVNGPTPGHV